MRQSIWIFLALILFGGSALYAQPAAPALREEQGIYQKVADIDLLIDGQHTPLSTLYQERPLIIVQIFTRCSGICSPALLQLQSNLRLLNATGKYQVLVFSFDPRDTPDDLRHYARRLAVDQEPNWHFATTAQIDALNASLGFASRWDAVREQYDHDALLTGINRQGIIKKKLIGIRSPHAVAEMIREINDKFTVSYVLPDQRRLFSCFNYNPATGQSEYGVGFLVMLIPALATLGCILLLGVFARRNAPLP